MPLTRYVKDLTAIRELQNAFTAPAFLDIRTLAVAFESDPEVIRELLPPPLLPAASPHVTVSVSDIGRSNCVGPFLGANVNIACTFEGAEGVYCLAMPMSTDTAVVFGRELYAEPKKLADIKLEIAESGRASGTVTRHGVTYLEIRGQFDQPMISVDRETLSSHYYVKFMPSADGRGFAHEPELIRASHRGRTWRVACGNALCIRQDRQPRLLGQRDRDGP